MPNVNPDISSSPPVSGNAEDPHHLELVCNHAATEGQVINSSTLSYSVSNPEAQPVLLTDPGLPKQYGLETVEVNDKPVTFSVKSPDDQGSGDASQGRGHERSKEDVIKEIGISSTAFIGPSCRPQTKIEEELSEFYKELEEIDHQDTVDEKTEINEDLSQPCTPTANPVPRKASRGTELKKTYRPYPTPRSNDWPPKDYGNTRRWRPPSHNNMALEGTHSYRCQGQWQHIPPRFPQGLQRFRFQEPQEFFPPPPPGNPMHQLYFEPEVNDYEHCESSSWGHCEETQIPLRYDVALTSSNRPWSYEWYERSASDWQPEHNHHEEYRYQRTGESFVLVLMRGLPGSGKTTLAKEILSTGYTGIILSTDDYFFQENGYFFDPTFLGDAHDWNQKRAREAMMEGRSPVIIDNTNVQAWEMKPYVAMALEAGYRVEFVEPNTSWKCDPTQLEKRNTHGVPRETIKKMLGRFEFPMTVDVVMNSREPPHKNKEHLSKPSIQKRVDDV